MHQGADAVAWVLVIGIYYVVYQHRVFDLPVSAWTIAASVPRPGFFLLLVSSRQPPHPLDVGLACHASFVRALNFSTAFRQSLTYPISGMWLFWLPLAWLGFEPKNIIAVVAINLGFQFFVHTQAIGKLGWLEYVFNTPSHPSRASRAQPEIHRPQLCRRADHLGQAVRQLRRGGPRRALRLRHHRPDSQPQPDHGSPSTNGSRCSATRHVPAVFARAFAQLFGPPERALSHTQRDVRDADDWPTSTGVQATFWPVATIAPV